MGIIEPTAAYVAGLAVVLGHVFPIWLKFKGGKGVATCFGVILALSPVAVLVSLIAWLLTAYFTRYSSLAALVGISLLPLTCLASGDFALAGLSVLFAALNAYTHRENIKRLRAGTEPKIGKK
jgi:glycerol-3-phosphate acyltransferase PlsY